MPLWHVSLYSAEHNGRHETATRLAPGGPSCYGLAMGDDVLMIVPTREDAAELSARLLPIATDAQRLAKSWSDELVRLTLQHSIEPILPAGPWMRGIDGRIIMLNPHHSKKPAKL